MYSTTTRFSSTTRSVRPGPLSFSVFPALNVGEVDADIETASPVLGLRPVRAGRLLVPKVPNPGSRTSSPSASASPMMSNTSSTASLAAPLLKELADFDFAASPGNEPLIQELAGGGFLESKRNIVLVGGTGTGKTHLAVAIARACTAAMPGPPWLPPPCTPRTTIQTAVLGIDPDDFDVQ